MVDEWSATIAAAVNLGCEAPSLTNTVGTACFNEGPEPFVDVDPLYWSSTLDDESPDRVWSVNLNHSRVEAFWGKDDAISVWAVRDSR